MANMLMRVCHVALVLATLWLTGGVHAQTPSLVVEKKPDADEVRRRAMEARVMQIGKEVSELQANLQSGIKAYQPLCRMCGNGVWMIEKRIDEATAKLETLKASNPHAPEVKTLKKELEEYRRVVRVMEEEAKPAQVAFQRLCNLQNQIRELEVERARLERALKSKWR